MKRALLFEQKTIKQIIKQRNNQQFMRQLICKGILLIFLIGTGINSFAQKPNTQALFDEANQLYQNQQFTEAAKTYQQLIDSGYQVDNLFFNAANAYLKSNQVGPAIYYYEKTLKLNPHHEAASNNLSIAEQKVENRPDELPLLFFQEWWMAFSQWHSPNGWAIASIVVAWVLAIAFILYKFFPKFRSNYLRWVIYALSVIFVAHLSMSIYMFNLATNSSSAIVIPGAATVKNAPGDSGKDLFEAHAGTKVKILDTTASYTKILMEDGKEGWIKAKDIKIL
ncbi:hypothetical protein COR50_04625 [Chitinophaga caeni]|uniref:SH3b domain-containing protein n=1 Tax=Chitinophaga caeni TaxID=2029983 RepID=A0A291QRG4_9BACT|nr:SH3 domain-containing protein [Chitinophaga caeni]ATL46516.1 hypothetical protein COR50_04625 [Chitinophaga caeni]